MKLTVGMKVRLCPFPKEAIHMSDESWRVTFEGGKIFIQPSMIPLFGQIVTISKVTPTGVRLEEDQGGWTFLKPWVSPAKLVRRRNAIIQN